MFNRISKSQMRLLVRFLTVIVACLQPWTNSAQAIDISWNGFGSATYGQALDKSAQMSPFTGNHVNFTNLSLMGLNVAGRINDDFSFAGQLVALGNPTGSNDAFTLSAQWATATYTPVEGTSIKVGRQLLPIFIASEYIHVGFLLPYQHMPATVYGLTPATRFDGISFLQSFNLGIGKLSLMAFGGTPIVDTQSALANGPGFSLAISGEDSLGGQVSLDGDGWRLKAYASRNYLASKSTINFSAPSTSYVVTPVSSLSDGHLQCFSASLRYDKNNIVTWAEWVMARMPDGTPQSDGGHAFANARGYYILGGYRLGRFLPRYSFAQGSQSYDIPPLGSAVINGQVTTHTLGVNYQAGNQAVLKLEIERNLFPFPGGGGYLISPYTNKATSADSFFAGVDFIF